MIISLQSLSWNFAEKFYNIKAVLKNFDFIKLYIIVYQTFM
jgi:hypothetical protein